MKVRNYLRQKYDLPEDDCRDIYQESLLTLYENIQNGKLTELTASLSCYFISKSDMKGAPPCLPLMPPP